MTSDTSFVGQFDRELERHSLDVENIRCHLNVVKWIGVGLVLVTIVTPISIGLSTCRVNRPLDCEMKIDVEPNLNRTLCTYVKQYHLRGGTYVTVCNHSGEMILDVRRFVNGTATILGIPLTLRQWLILKQLTPEIDRAVGEARTYWKTLRKL
ncbi:hypothetical protein BOW31_12875 [Solemya velum gill symbiont]|nr:hypothetical protein BOW31_12875 [Solemya velum gill symbiont]